MLEAGFARPVFGAQRAKARTSIWGRFRVLGRFPSRVPFLLIPLLRILVALGLQGLRVYGGVVRLQFGV